ncbi:MAG: hypothetical protein Harvfovirus5_43 [Harvfovirus sp.]|uniref:TRAF-type domain-containing protein n=1 Tax=Harvfovirus sp. TaxID=2487768 RepID=A0A3G5A5H4_9VIRU|nr:MAG: hypothetical protein Harvfovirus5_43 [Harvfovirus sp.]
MASTSIPGVFTCSNCNKYYHYCNACPQKWNCSNIPCEFEGKLWEVKAHIISECKYRTEKCEYCDVPFPFQEMKSHLETCVRKRVECAYCEEHIIIGDVEKHKMKCLVETAAQFKIFEKLYGNKLVMAWIEKGAKLVGPRDFSEELFNTDQEGYLTRVEAQWVLQIRAYEFSRLM